ncbi:3-oxoacyl-[acyl-carrier-protein] reductase [Propionibacterium freudenreichii]|nr:3-oxoacyl-[acyl-carrier-protein] reductase [Propionibacterium freudenreichii]PWM96159.1 MAG: 3-oxoacyl-[acyl-carrier-protein] reductase [Propionibacterium sp.]MCT2974326.1 3-oxoacyl-[acyl-carrier-protein] reductase [Propionibacterium freudenreichii]MCT2976550.1 3-oxoacyl-[acyl-carrier-protein] reductase [Propionibacterium freudenreichii]MCT2977404.1 3-oxoacyl-[acyl-carrier-protein] reductase [Propionibacterium freudenreichii]
MPAGRVALVTGASRGIGAEIATELLAAGYRVAGTSRSGRAPDGVLGVSADITDPEQVEAAFARVEEELGGVEVLVANAGITRDMLLMRMSDDDWDGVLATNLTGTFRMVRRATRRMMRARFGRIVLMSSVSAYVGSPGQVNYSASKAGLIGMARSVARELGGRGITCNVVAPGFISTDMTDELSDEVKDDYLARIPAKRFGETRDVAHAVRFLCSDAAGYVTGAVLPVDGGLGMGR